MEISGKLIKILQEVRGESQRGPWVRGGFVIETDGEYPRQVAFTTFGEDRLAMVKSLALNSPVVVNFNPESREYEGRWYTDLRCSRVQPFVPGQMPAAPTAATGYSWAAQPQGATPAATPSTPAQPAAPASPAQDFAAAPQMPSNGDDDLPF